MMKRITLITILVALCACGHMCLADNKYSQQSNQPDKLDRPFRMQKNNMLWEKAKARLSEGKLKTLFKELKDLDKDEIKVKKLRAEKQDKADNKAGEVRRRYALILSKYNLQDTAGEDAEDNLTSTSGQTKPTDKQIFKDKKLDRLWKKAEQQSFTDQEMIFLKEEFKKHEKRLDDYNLQIERVAEKEEKIKKHLDSKHNSIDTNEQHSNEHLHQLKQQHRDIKRHFNDLEDKVLHKNLFTERGYHFEEPRVAKLWQMAAKVGFEDHELKQLKEELEHFESRVKKIAYLEEHYSIGDQQVKRNMDDKLVNADDSKHIKGRLHDLTKHVDKLERDLEMKIMSKHIEL